MAEMKHTSHKCPNCGANLSVGEDQERFDCAYCGTTVTVERKGAEISLSMIGRVVAQHLAGGSERKAAEMEVARLTSELSAVRTERSRHDHASVEALRPLDERIAALGDRPGRGRVLLLVVGMTLPALLWLVLGEHAPIFPVGVILLVAWWVARRHSKVAAAIASFVTAWTLTYAALGLSCIPFFAGGTQPLPLWMIVTFCIVAVPVAGAWTLFRTRRREARRKAALDALQAERAPLAARLEAEDRVFLDRIRKIEERIARNRAIAQA